MALSILDGNQSATTLSTILSSGQHITAHTVISLGTQAITDIVNATSANLTNTQLRASAVTIGGTVTVGNSLTISSLPAISGTVNTRNNGINNDPWVYIPRLTMSHPSIGSVTFDGYYRFDGVNTWGNTNLNTANAPYLTRGVEGDEYIFKLMIHDEGNDVEIQMANATLPSPDFPTFMTAAYGTLVSGSLTFNTEQRESYGVRVTSSITVGNSVTIGSLPALVAGTNRIGVVTIGGGTVTIGAGTAQIGSVTASISGTVPISISSVTVGNFPATQAVSLASLPALAAGTAQIGSVTASISGTVPVSISSVTVGNSVTIASLPALAAGTAQIGSVTASISNSVVTFTPAQGTTVANSNFTSTTASTSLVSADSGREVLTVFNEGAGNLHISPGATATTISYQVRLSAGDYWECPAGQLTLAHTAVFATAGTARVTQVS